MGTNFVQIGEEVVVDLTNDSVTPETLAEGETAHNAKGNLIRGTMTVYKNLTLGVHTDGLLYIFSNGEPIGVGVEMPDFIGDIYGNIDSDNNIVFKGNMPDGTYTAKFVDVDGSTVNIGVLVKDTTKYFSIAKTLTNCIINNSATSIAEGEPYKATITANDGYALKSVTVTMGGSPVSVSGGVINIASVTGNIVISAVAEVAGPAYTNQIPLSINSDGTPFVGTNGEKGYKTNTRLSGSSGTEKTESGYEVTGFIPVAFGDEVSIKDIDIPNENNTNIAFYKNNSDKTYIGTQTLYTAFVTNGTSSNGVYTATINQNQLNALTSSVGLGYIRISSKSITNESILTVNQEIV